MSHITPSFSKTAGSRKVSAGWSLEPRVPSLDCTIHNAQDPSVFAPTPSLNSLQASLVLSCCVIRRRILTSGRGTSPVRVETRICTAMENGHERRLRRIKGACGETNASQRANSEHRSLDIVIYHFQCGIIYSAAREIFQQNIRKYFQHFCVSEVPFADLFHSQSQKRALSKELEASWMRSRESNNLKNSAQAERRCRDHVRSMSSSSDVIG